ncbi:ATP-dependent RNA helicase [Novymonas esmeraldas]|uniref:Probable eukaryotic initiation factor 4A n=1 Tax=Novymonas esmeraldas TaxID=1808958 RepID=A0AAW0ERS5_9TRYP
MAEFQRLGVQPWLARQCAYMALDTPTPIQRSCIPAILGGHHVVGGAATGSGKTAAFALPILQTLAVDTYGVFALVLTPSRELAYQIIDQFIALGAPLQVRTMLAIGGVPTETQVDALKARPHIVAATPGRLRHLLHTFAPELTKAFAHLRFIVLDEADRLTDGDIQRDVRALLRMLPPRPQRRALLFTATLHPRLTTLTATPAPPPTPTTTAATESAAKEEQEEDAVGVTDSFDVLAELGVTDAATLTVVVERGAVLDATVGPATTAPSAAPYDLPETLQQRYLFIPNMVKLPYLVAALRAAGKTQSTIVYTNSCLRAELVRLTLQLLGFPVCSLDSLLSQQHRLDSVASFKLGLSRVLVCTDIAARGLDIPAVGLVLHYDVPKHAETYVHRVGRTARAGREGTSVALVTEYDVSLVQRIEKRIGSTLSLWQSPAARESAVLPLLDEVSAAKVQAKQQVMEQFEARVHTNKAHAAEKRQTRAQLQQAARAAPRPVRAPAAPQPVATTAATTGALDTSGTAAAAARDAPTHRRTRSATTATHTGTATVKKRLSKTAAAAADLPRSPARKRAKKSN